MNNEVLKAMKTRRSIRKYKPEQITDVCGYRNGKTVSGDRGSAETGTDRKTFEDERGCDGKQQ